jgi:alcohol dehydrogenase class IV
MLPYIIQYNSIYTNKYQKLEKALGIGNLITAIKDLNKRLNIPETLGNVAKLKLKRPPLCRYSNA